MTALPTDPTELSAGPSRVDIEALHLSINQTWESGSSQNIQLLENGDIGAILSKGQPKRTQIPCAAERGTIVIALNVDEDHDEVHYSNVAFRGEAGGAAERGDRGAGRVPQCTFTRAFVAADRLPRIPLAQSGTCRVDPPSLLAGLSSLLRSV
jgi:hypothetical protein